MSSLKLVPADTLDNESLTRLLNQAYTDYYLTIWLEPDQFRRMCEEVDVDLARSIVAMVGETPVGLALLSMRDKDGWISGVGVSPPWRRRGIAQRLLEQIQTNAPDYGLDRLRLEVLAQNGPGITLYQRLGFEHERELLVLSLDAGRVPLARVPASISSEQPSRLLDHYDRLHDGASAPWQRALPSLRSRVSRLQGLAFCEASRLIGYVLYEPHNNTYAVVDLAVDPTHEERIKIGRRLLKTLHGLRDDVGGYIVNVPAGEALLAAFEEIGYRIWQRQHEMVWPVQAPSLPNVIE